MNAARARFSEVTVLLLATCSTGMVDAIGYVLLGNVLPANMTGNLVLAAISAGRPQQLLLGPVVTLAAFICGAWAAGRVVGLRTHRGWTTRAGVSFLTVALLVAGVGLAVDTLAGTSRPTVHEDAAVAAVLGAAMGLQAATARAAGVAEINTIVITLPLVALGFDGFAAEQRPAQVARLLSVSVLGLGALGGGVAAHLVGGRGLLLPAVLLVLTTCAGLRLARK